MTNHNVLRTACVDNDHHTFSYRAFLVVVGIAIGGLLTMWVRPDPADFQPVECVESASAL